MDIGSFGQTVFEVSRERLRSFEGFGKESSARLNSVDIIGGEPLTEFVGPGSKTVSFTLRLSRQLGADPEGDLKTLEDMQDAGTAATLVLGGKPYGGPGAQWIIESLSATYRHWSRGGLPLWIDVVVTIRKYVQVEQTT